MITQYIFWALVGWCGTPWRRWPPPPPPPDPWGWWKNALFGIVGGIAGSLLVKTGLGFEDVVSTSFGALAGGRIISDIAGSFLGSQKG